MREGQKDSVNDHSLNGQIAEKADLAFDSAFNQALDAGLKVVAVSGNGELMEHSKGQSATFLKEVPKRIRVGKGAVLRLKR